MSERKPLPVVLVYEKIEDTRQFLLDTLKNTRVRVILIDTFSSLISKVQQYQIDLVCYGMGVLDSQDSENLQKLSDLKKEIKFKISVIGGYNDPKMNLENFSLDDFITKPLDMMSLLNRIRHLLNIENEPMK